MRLIDADELLNNIAESYLTKAERRLLSIKIRHAPTVEERPQGEWITDNLVRPYGICSQCGQICETENFCGNCGADMRGDNNG